MARKTSWHKKNIVGTSALGSGPSDATVNSTANADGSSSLFPPGSGVDRPTPGGGNNIIPTNLRIAKQVVQYDDFGFPYVDVTFEWDAVDGVLQQYNLRVAETNND